MHHWNHLTGWRPLDSSGLCEVRERAGTSNVSTAINCVGEQFWQTVNRYTIVWGELIDGFEVEVIVVQLWAAPANQIGWRRTGRHSSQPDNRPIDSEHRWSWPGAQSKAGNLKCAIHERQKDLSVTPPHCGPGRPILAPYLPSSSSSDGWEKEGTRRGTAPWHTESKLFSMKAEGDAKEEDPPFFLPLLLLET